MKYFLPSTVGINLVEGNVTSAYGDALYLVKMK